MLKRYPYSTRKHLEPTPIKVITSDTGTDRRWDSRLAPVRKIRNLAKYSITILMNKALLRVNTVVKTVQEAWPRRSSVVRVGARDGVQRCYRGSMTGQSNRKGLRRVSNIATER